MKGPGGLLTVSLPSVEDTLVNTVEGSGGWVSPRSLHQTQNRDPPEIRLPRKAGTLNDSRDSHRIYRDGTSSSKTPSMSLLPLFFTFLVSYTTSIMIHVRFSQSWRVKAGGSLLGNNWLRLWIQSLKVPKLSCLSLADNGQAILRT